MLMTQDAEITEQSDSGKQIKDLTMKIQSLEAALGKVMMSMINTPPPFLPQIVSYGPFGKSILKHFQLTCREFQVQLFFCELLEEIVLTKSRHRSAAKHMKRVSVCSIC